VPLLASAIAVATNLVVVVTGFPHIGFRAVALGTALGSLLNALVLGLAFEKRVGGLLGHGLLRPVLRMAVAAAVMGALAWASAAGLERAFGTHGLRAQLVTGLLPVCVGVVTYAALTRLFRVPEAEAVLGMVRSRLGR
jgi:putative peptidoglycan lipid II flippase